jgi:hypothetical protein
MQLDEDLLEDTARTLCRKGVFCSISRCAHYKDGYHWTAIERYRA